MQSRVPGRKWHHRRVEFAVRAEDGLRGEDTVWSMLFIYHLLESCFLFYFLENVLGNQHRGAAQ